MHFVTLVPLSAAVAFVVIMAILKGFLILAIGIIALIAWGIYVLFFKKDKVEEEIEEEVEELEPWEKYLQEQEKNDADYYRRIGRLEQQLEDIENQVGVKKKRKNRN